MILQRPVLVLNKAWQPVHVATLARALVLLFKESAVVVNPADYQTFTWEDWSKFSPLEGDAFLRSVNCRFCVPEVIRLNDYDRTPQRSVTFSRRNVYKRDKFRCQYCGVNPGGEELTIDHVNPRAQGGVSSWTNCVLACIS